MAKLLHRNSLPNQLHLDHNPHEHPLNLNLQPKLKQLRRQTIKILLKPRFPKILIQIIQIILDNSIMLGYNIRYKLELWWYVWCIFKWYRIKS